MNRYEIRCTEEQTKKALKLGAPIIEHEGVTTVGAPNGYYLNDNVLTKIPTAEQMIGWLEEQNIYGISIEEFEGDWIYHIRTATSTESINNELYPYNSRKEATLAAIDAALDYLEKMKEEK